MNTSVQFIPIIDEKNTTYLLVKKGINYICRKIFLIADDMTCNILIYVN